MLALVTGAALIVSCGSQNDKAAVNPSGAAAERDRVPDLASVSRDPARSDMTEQQRWRDAERVVAAFYRDLNVRRFDRAWRRLTPSLQGRLGGFADWKAGYSTSVSTAVMRAQVTAMSANTARLSVALRARDRDVCDRLVTQRFDGSWRMARTNGRWLVAEIGLRKTAGTAPVSDRNSCPTPSSRLDANAPPPAAAGGSTERVCLDEVTLPAVRLPATRLDPVTLPAFVDVDGVRHPAQRIPGRTIPGVSIPGRTIRGRCWTVPAQFAPSNTSILTDGYERVDLSYSPELTRQYWSRSGRATIVPDYSAPGFGEVNAAGFPRNQYVRPYVRRDGTYVSGYWRNSPADGLPTCRIIDC